MIRKSTSILLCMAFFFTFTTSDSFSQESKKAKNVILMIGDGMGFTSDLAGTYYRYGRSRAQSYHSFRLLASATFSITDNDFDEDKDAGYASDFFWKGLDGTLRLNNMVNTTDSAASATALNSGEKTLDGRIGMGINGRPLSLFADEASKELGMSIGAVTSVTLSNATPAAVMAHQHSRKLNREISREQILDQSGLTVLIGSGHPEKSSGETRNPEDWDEDDYEYVGGSILWRLLQKQAIENVTMVDTKEGFDRYKSGVTAENAPKRLLGVVPDGSYLPPVDACPEDGSTEILDRYFEGNLNKLKKMFPSLSDLSLDALNILSQNEKGFYLMIEGGAIDSANHENDLPREVLEHTSFSRAVDTVIDWVETNSSWDETLLIITADHETGQLWGPGTYKDTNGNGGWDDGEPFNGFQHLVNNGVGKLPGAMYARGNHTNALVPVWIKGAGEKNVDSYIRGIDKTASEFYAQDGYLFDGEYIYNSDVAKIMRDAVGLGK